jgi:hypothetical protein
MKENLEIFVEGYASDAYSKLSQALIGIKRFILSKDNANFREFQKSGSLNGYASDFIEDARNASTFDDMEQIKTKCEIMIRRLDDDIEAGKKDLEDKELPRLQKNQVRVILGNWINLRRTLILVVERLNAKIQARHEENANNV